MSPPQQSGGGGGADHPVIPTRPHSHQLPCRRPVTQPCLVVRRATLICFRGYLEDQGSGFPKVLQIQGLGIVLRRRTGGTKVFRMPSSLDFTMPAERNVDISTLVMRADRGTRGGWLRDARRVVVVVPTEQWRMGGPDEGGM